MSFLISMTMKEFYLDYLEWKGIYAVPLKHQSCLKRRLS